MDVLTVTGKGENMRKVVAWLFISLDGVVEAPNEWQFDVFDEAMGASIATLSAEEDTMLFGSSDLSGVCILLANLHGRTFCKSY